MAEINTNISVIVIKHPKMNLCQKTAVFKLKFEKLYVVKRYILKRKKI